MSIVLTNSTIRSEIKRHLSIIGKRLYSKDGKNMFSDVTLSSAEEKDILSQYINAAAQDVESVLHQFISSATYTTGESAAITMEIANTRGETDFDARSKDMIQSYIVLNSVGEYLSMVHPDIAQKYQRDAQQRLESLIAYVFYKKPPTT